MSAGQEAEEAEEDDEEDEGQGDETVAGDALFVTEGTQPLNVAGGQIVDEFGIGGGRAAEMTLDAFGHFHQIEFAGAHFVEMAGGGQGFGSILEFFLVHALEERLAVGGGAGGGRGARTPGG